jgi:hypothetical protein
MKNQGWLVGETENVIYLKFFYFKGEESELRQLVRGLIMQNLVGHDKYFTTLCKSQGRIVGYLIPF